MKHKRKANTQPVPELDPTSTLNSHVMCECGRKYSNKYSLLKHIKQCDGTQKPSLVCTWCNLEFKNRGNLVNHLIIHGGKGAQIKYSQDNNETVFKCNVCKAIFDARFKLTYHIRRLHYNLRPTIPHCEEKEVNQTWFETVLNTDSVMKIKKTGVNTLVMKPMPPDPHIKTLNANQIDLTLLYPTGKTPKSAQCKICNKVFTKYHLKKHMDEKHYHNYKMQCNKCNQMFKRVYIYLKHNCSGKRRNRNRPPNVRQVRLKPFEPSAMQITGVTSLKTVEVE